MHNTSLKVDDASQKKTLTFKNVLSFEKTQMLIVGHRGGFKPDNTISAFREAKDNQLQAVELDVWITLDDQIVVIHGGQDGELPGDSGTYVFDYNLDGLRQEYSGTKEFQENLTEFGPDVQIPTLKEVFELFGGEVLVNVEIKAPKTEVHRRRYDTGRLISNLDKLIQESDLVEQTLISSFDHDLLEKYQDYQKSKEQQSKVDFLYLSTFTKDGIVQEVPEKSITDSW